MSETVIFIFGSVVFAISTYGAVMAGGTALTRVELDQSQLKDKNFDDVNDLDKPLPLRGKY